MSGGEEEMSEKTQQTRRKDHLHMKEPRRTVT
jgi:hypothetical protein